MVGVNTIGRWAHEEQSGSNHAGRRGIRRRLVSARFRPKRDWRRQKANSPRRPGQADTARRPGEANFLPGETKSCEAESGRQRCQAGRARRAGQQASGGRGLSLIEVPCALRGKRSALIGAG